MTGSRARVGALWSELRRRHVVRVAFAYLAASFIVLQAAALLFPALNLPEWTFQALVAFALLGFPLALVLAWAIELSPDGAVANVSPPVARRANGDLDPPAKSLAVLPLQNIGGSVQDEFFADGLTEDIIAQLAKIRDLKVISRTSVMRFKRDAPAVTEIAQLLQVRTILEGSVRRAGNRLRVVVQLIDAGTDDHLWAETYDREVEDVFAIQSDIARRVASALRAEITSEESARIDGRPTESSEAYDCYLLGRQFYTFGGYDDTDLRKAAHFFEKAIELDPEFAAPHLSLAVTYWGLTNSTNSAALHDLLPRGRMLAERALALEPENGEAHAVRGFYLSEVDFDWEGADRSNAEAIRLSPNSSLVLRTSARALVRFGRHSEARALLDRALAIDPMAFIVNWYGGMHSLISGRDADTEAFIGKCIELDPGSAYARMLHLQLLMKNGRDDEALRELEGFDRGSVERANYGAGVVGAVYARNGRLREARELAEELEERSRDGLASHVAVAMVHVALGDEDRAVEILARIVDQRPRYGWDSFVGVLPEFAPLAASPRYQEILQQLGLPARTRSVEVAAR